MESFEPQGDVKSVHLLVASQTPQHKHASFASLPLSPYLSSVDRSGYRITDPHADDQMPVDDKKNPELRPGKRVRQQSMDLIGLIVEIARCASQFYTMTDQ